MDELIAARVYHTLALDSWMTFRQDAKRFPSVETRARVREARLELNVAEVRLSRASRAVECCAAECADDEECHCTDCHATAARGRTNGSPCLKASWFADAS